MKDNDNIIPILTYNNMDINKSIIILDNKRKCGIYRITNLTSSKIYIGSSNNLSSRFRVYLNINQLMRSNMYIYKAILKYGYSNFTLDILEYCEPNVLKKREQYYLDILKPEYNILKIAGSTLGFKHSLNTRIKIGKALRSNSAIDIRPNLDTNKAKLNPFLLRSKTRKNIKVFDQSNNIVNEFPTMKSAALYLNVSTWTIRKILKNEILHVGFTYKFKIKDTRI